MVVCNKNTCLLKVDGNIFAVDKKNLHALGKCCLGLAGYLHENVQLSLEEWAGGLMSVGSEHPWFGWISP